MARNASEASAATEKERRGLAHGVKPRPRREGQAPDLVELLQVFLTKTAGLLPEEEGKASGRLLAPG